MRRPIIAGNWKMNKGIAETGEYVTQLNSLNIPNDRDVIICPTFIALCEAAKRLKNAKVCLGAQNMHFNESGAYTGEISPLSIKEVGCKYVIIGHSERRHVFGEDNILISSKVASALNHDLTPILCVGETLDERKQGKTEKVVENQVNEGLEELDDPEKVVIAYEPVWAIGTGVTATPKQAEQVHFFIRSIITDKFDQEFADKVRILYGGSVNPGNVKQLMKQPNIDGVLVGGASLEADKFQALINFDK